MKSYEIWIAPSAGSIHVRVEIVAAKCYRAAYLSGQQLCHGDEFVRGCIEL